MVGSNHDIIAAILKWLHDSVVGGHFRKDVMQLESNLCFIGRV